MNEEDLIDYPIRINRYLELKGVATRRGADELIKKGLVLVNGQPAIIGYKVQTRDKVEVLAGAEDEKKFIYLAYYKPRGLATEDIKVKGQGPSESGQKVFPLGRLDKESEGLIILTNDGRITDRLLNPKYAHEKEYEVEVKEKVSPMHKKILEGGIISLREMLKAKHVEITGPSTMTILLTEGKKHQIRRMLDGAHLTVKSLKRVRVMNIKLGKLRSGEWRDLTPRERSDFFAEIGLK